MAASNSPAEKLSSDALRELDRTFDRQLRELQEGSTKAPSVTPFSTGKFLLKMTLLMLSLLIPFFVLIRSSVYMYSHYQLNGWLALVIGALSTIGLLAAYGLYLTFRFGMGSRFHRYIVRGAAVLVFSYTLYGLLYYSSVNTKTAEIESYYLSLHPVMRVAMATITLAESDLIITDIQRQPEDYARMGLPENQESLHYLQSSGYVHAVDVRTIGRAEWKNWLTRFLFTLSGFETIRHVGTADHLHVYLPLND